MPKEGASVAFFGGDCMQAEDAVGKAIADHEEAPMVVREMRMFWTLLVSPACIRAPRLSAVEQLSLIWPRQRGMASRALDVFALCAIIVGSKDRLVANDPQHMLLVREQAHEGARNVILYWGHPVNGDMRV